MDATTAGYLIVKTSHLLSVIGWMATVLCLPHLVVEIAMTKDDVATQQRLVTMGRRLYRLGHHLFGLAFIFGMTLWLHFGFGGRWLHVKLVLVAMLLAHFTIGGRWLKGLPKGRALPSVASLRWFARAPAFLLPGVVWLALARNL